MEATIYHNLRFVYKTYPHHSIQLMPLPIPDCGHIRSTQNTKQRQPKGRATAKKPHTRRISTTYCLLEASPLPTPDQIKTKQDQTKKGWLNFTSWNTTKQNKTKQKSKETTSSNSIAMSNLGHNNLDNFQE